MPKNNNTLSEGAGATRSQSGSRTGTSETYGSGSSTSATSTSRTYGSDTYGNDDYYADRSRSREVVVSDYEESNRPERATIVGAALAGAVIGAAIPFMLGRSSSGGGRKARSSPSPS